VFPSSLSAHVVVPTAGRCLVVSLTIWFCGLGILSCGLAHGDIINWRTGETIPGTEGISPEPGVQLTNWNTEVNNLHFADFEAMDLGSAAFDRSWLDDARFTDADLTYAT
jgi:hypothetical protein